MVQPIAETFDQLGKFRPIDQIVHLIGISRDMVKFWLVAHRFDVNEIFRPNGLIILVGRGGGLILHNMIPSLIGLRLFFLFFVARRYLRIRRARPALEQERISPFRCTAQQWN